MAKKKKKSKWILRWRSAITGKFIDRWTAQELGSRVTICERLLRSNLRKSKSDLGDKFAHN